MIKLRRVKTHLMRHPLDDRRLRLLRLQLLSADPTDAGKTLMPNRKESLRQKEPLSFAMVASKARFSGIGLIAARGLQDSGARGPLSGMDLDLSRHTTCYSTV